MVTLRRRDLTAFRTLSRRCRPTRAPDPNALLRVTVARTSLRLLAATADVTLGYTGATESRGDDLDWCLPVAVLDVAEQTAAETIELQPLGPTRGQLRWTGGERTFDLTPANRPVWPDGPDRWGSADGSLLTALHEAGRLADRTPGRWASHRVQVQGGAGRVVGTDTRQALIWGGFRFPFAESVLVPAVAAFGSTGWKREPVRVGRTMTQVVVAVGPWTVGLAIDPSGRFPDADAVVPRSPTPTLVRLGEADARAVLARLGGASGAAGDTAVTLDAQDGRVAVRWRTDDQAAPSELRLAGSRCSGPAVRYALARPHLARGLALGFRSLRLCGGNRPLALTDRQRLYLVNGHDPATAIPPEAAERIAEDPPAPLSLRSPPPNPEPTMPLPTTRTGSSPDDESTPDPLTEAEAVRDALAGAADRAARLVQLLKARRKADRALSQAVRSLRALPLGRT